MTDRPLADTIVATAVVDLERASPSELPRTDMRARYNTLSGLGEGGMGEVWLLRDGVIGRDVAMKSIKNELRNDALSRARFLREARIQGQLEHPSIVPVYDLGVGPSGQPYFTMRRVRGRTLDELGKLPLHTALTVMSRVCLAIDFAHAHGVLHRDIKPSNVMVGDWGEVYVLDWGIAKLAGKPDEVELESKVTLVGDDLDATTAGALLGTPGYMSPEQAQSQTLDARGDVYSLGATLFELLTGHPLHLGTSVAALMRSTTAGADACISKRHPELDIPLELEAICVRATKTAPADRFASAREMHDAIERFLEGDRDLELRRKRSVEHARLAVKARKRSVAMREVGRALALDPENADAMRTLVRLLTDPPKKLPREVAREIDEERIRALPAARRFAAIAFGSALLPSLLVWWMGVRDMPWFVVSVIAGGTAASLNVVSSGESITIRRTATIAAAFVGMIAASRLAGVFVAIPVLALGLAIGLIAFPRRFKVGVSMAVAIASIVVPLVLERLGFLSSMYDLSPDRICVRAELATFSTVPTIVYFLVITLGPIAAVALYLGRLVERADGADRRLRLMAWQLRQIVPKEKV